jgi:signal transduction histidine kinase
MNVLIVEDNATNRRVLQATLVAEKMIVFTANDGIEALAVLEREKIDAIITDILMPRMDGYRLCFQKIPLIVYTATYTTASDEELSLRLGADRFLRKPAKASVMIEALREVTRSPRVPGPPHTEPAGLDLMKSYSERLVAKLEQRNQELEVAREELRVANVSLEERVQQRTSRLEEANEQLESFAYFVSHELRTPLRAVAGYANALRDDFGAELPSEAQRLIGVVVNGANRMSRLLEDLLNFSRLGRQEVRKREVDVGSIVLTAVEELRPVWEPRHVAIQVGSLPKAAADPTLLKQVFLNLLGNALKFTRPRTDVRIEVGGRPDAAGTVFFVKDNGVGFEMERAGKLFTPFERLHLATEFEGTGLGLGIVRMIVERHGGRAWAEGAVDQGATFFFTLGAA